MMRSERIRRCSRAWWLPRQLEKGVHVYWGVLHRQWFETLGGKPPDGDEAQGGAEAVHRGGRKILRLTLSSAPWVECRVFVEDFCSNDSKLYLRTILIMQFKLCLHCGAVLGGSLVEQPSPAQRHCLSQSDYTNQSSCRSWRNRCSERIAVSSFLLPEESHKHNARVKCASGGNTHSHVLFTSSLNFKNFQPLYF